MKAINMKLNFTSILVGYSPLGMVNNGDYFFTLSSCKQTRQQQILSLRRVSTTNHIHCHWSPDLRARQDFIQRSDWWITFSPHAIYFIRRIHYKLRHAFQQYFWIKLNCATITNQKKICSDLLAQTWNVEPAFTSALLQDLLSLCHTHGWAASVARFPKKCPLNFQHW